MRNIVINRTIKQSVQLAIFALGFTLVACNQENVAKVTAEEPPRVTKTKSNANVNMDQLVASAVAELAEHTGIAVNAITVTEARTVHWSSSAVGCPADDMNYTQVIIPGILLLLEADGKIYRYHGRNSGSPFHCPNEQAEAPVYGAGEEFM